MASTHPSTSLLAVIDWNTGSVLIDGVPVPGVIGSDIEMETNEGMLGVVYVPLFVQNILVLHRDGSRSSPTARDAATNIVREGLADVLAWLESTPNYPERKYTP